MGYTEAQARAFINEIAPLIVAEGKKRGYSVYSTVIAQAIIEGACNTSGLAKPPYNNHFGLKCGPYWKGRSVNMKTKEEYVVGSPVTIKDNFRCYGSMAECVSGYYDFISTKRYENLKTARDYNEYAQRLKFDGYATSSTYVASLCSTVLKYGLNAYDSGTVAPVNVNGYIIGKTYTTDANLYIRVAPNGDKIEPKSLTSNAQINAYTDDEGYSILRKGTKVTCKGIKVVNNSTWMQIPSGWICAIQNNKKYII